MDNQTPDVIHIEQIDKERLIKAVKLSEQCIPVQDAFSVGALVYDASGALISSGYSREIGNRSHAEEVALNKAHNKGINLSGGTIYCSLEPCSKRSSSDKTCTHRIFEAGITKVVFAMREPILFVNPASLNRFEKAGIQIIHISELEPAVRSVNKHLFQI